MAAASPLRSPAAESDESKEQEEETEMMTGIQTPPCSGAVAASEGVRAASTLSAVVVTPEESAERVNVITGSLASASGETPAGNPSAKEHATDARINELKVFVGLEAWAEETRTIFEKCLETIPLDLIASVTNSLLAAFQQHVETDYPPSVQAKKNIMQSLKEDWFASDGMYLVKAEVKQHLAVAKFVPLVPVSELAVDEQDHAQQQLRLLRSHHLPQLEQRCDDSWRVELQRLQEKAPWIVSKEVRVNKLKKEYLRKHYYASVADLVRDGGFTFVPLVHPSDIHNDIAQMRARKLMAYVKEEHLPQIDSCLKETWDQQKETIACLSEEEKEESKIAFHLHVYWDIVARVVEWELSGSDPMAREKSSPSTTQPLKRTPETEAATTRPQKRRQMTTTITKTLSSPLKDIVYVHTTASAGEICTLEAGVMAVVDDVPRGVKVKSPKTGLEEDSQVGKLQLGDAQGVVACSFWREVANRHWEDFKDKLDESLDLNQVAFYRVTHLSVTDTKNTSLTPLRVLNTTDNTTVQFLDFRMNTIRVQESLCVKDYTHLQRPLPYTGSLEGTVIEPFSRRASANGVPMCSFRLVRNGLSVACVAHGANAEHDFLRPNAQILVFGAVALDDRQRPNMGKGTLWMYDDAFIMKTGDAQTPPKVTRLLTLP